MKCCRSGNNRNPCTRHMTHTQQIALINIQNQSSLLSAPSMSDCPQNSMPSTEPEVSSIEQLRNSRDRIREKQARVLSGLHQAIQTLERMNSVLENIDRKTCPAAETVNHDSLGYKMKQLKEELRLWKNVL